MGNSTAAGTLEKHPGLIAMGALLLPFSVWWLVDQSFAGLEWAEFLLAGTPLLLWLAISIGPTGQSQDRPRRAPLPVLLALLAGTVSLEYMPNDTLAVGWGAGLSLAVFTGILFASDILNPTRRGALAWLLVVVLLVLQLLDVRVETDGNDTWASFRSGDATRFMLLAWVCFYRPGLVRWGLIVLAGLAASAAIMCFDAGGIDLPQFIADTETGFGDIFVELRLASTSLQVWLHTALAGALLCLALPDIDGARPVSALGLAAALGLCLIGAGLDAPGTMADGFADSVWYRIGNLDAFAAGLARMADAVTLAAPAWASQETLDTIVLVGRRRIEDAFSIGHLPVLTLGTVLLGWHARRAWPVALIAVAVLVAATRIPAWLDGGGLQFAPVTMLAAMLLTVTGSRLSRRRIPVVVKPVRTKPAPATTGTADAAPAPDSDPVELTDEAITRTASWRPYSRPAFRAWAARIRPPAGDSEIAFDARFQPLRFKLTETLLAARPAIWATLALSIALHAYVAIRYGVPVAMSANFLIGNIFGTLDDALNAFIIPVFLLIVGTVCAPPLLSGAMQDKPNRRRARALYLTLDGAIGLRAQAAASFGAALVWGAASFYALEDDFGEAAASVLAVAGWAIFVPAAIWLFYLGAFRIPGLVMTSVGNTAIVSRIASGLLHYLVAGITLAILSVILEGLGIVMQLGENALTGWIIAHLPAGIR